MSSNDVRESRIADPSVGAFVDAARQIGLRLGAEAIWHEDRCCWTGDEIAYWGGEWRPVHRSVDGWLYNGTSGIARFLAHLWRAVGDESCRVTALGALRHALAQAERALSPSLWSGAAGTACVTVEIGGVLNDPGLVARGLRLGDRIAAIALDSKVPESSEQDVIAGRAGTCVAFAYLARRGAGQRVTAACHSTGSRLVRTGRRLACGWSWGMNEGQEDAEHLCGVAHGASGIAAALLEAYTLGRDVAFLDAAWEGMRYEKSWFNPRLSNWPDLRETATQSPTNPTYPDFWCHGAAGIGMVRLRAYAVTKNLTPLAEAGAAIQAVRPTLQSVIDARLQSLPADWNLSVCHGLGSVAELLLYAHEVLGANEYLTAARGLGSVVLDDLGKHNRDWPCGVPGGEGTPGLMLGLAGIGLWYLRLADPFAVPPVTMWT